VLRSFDDPFRVDGRTLHGAASVGIAVYPEDALTKDGLLNAADTDMYKAKNAKKHIVHLLEGDDHRTLAPKGAA
jgi:predicted signal transduction protein with EAL and GGDEF domain